MCHKTVKHTTLSQQPTVNSAIHPFVVDKWVVSRTQAFAMLCVVAAPGECVQGKADMVMFAGNTVIHICVC